MTTEEKLTRARTLLLLDHPFFGTLALRLPLVEDSSYPTACTDGAVIRYNPQFIDSLTPQQVGGMLAHEVMHLANGHPWRRDARNLEQWNNACDLAINHILKISGIALPKDMPDAQHYKDKAAESIYAVLAQEQGQKPAGGDKGSEGAKGAPTQGKSPKSKEKTDPGGCGSFEDPAVDAQVDTETEWKVAVAQAYQAAKAAGDMPGSLKRMVQDIVDPVVPWAVLLRDFVERAARNDYNWTRPNRRYLGRGFFLPSLISEDLPEIVVAIDTSGSIRPGVLDLFAQEVSAVLDAYETTIHVVYCDAKVRGEEHLTRADLPLKLTPVGGGGTKFGPVFEWVKEQEIEPACLIYLTDLECHSYPVQEPDYPTIWICTAPKREARFGQTIHITV